VLQQEAALARVCPYSSFPGLVFRSTTAWRVFLSLMTFFLLLCFCLPACLLVTAPSLASNRAGLQKYNSLQYVSH
jgi:hypothetical protein